ncbi:MAG TPA: glycosyltransferase, partial [Methylomirabilota bacterium]|nr:glycosyltransferase [Methylomirabilota bacterium]
MAVAEALRAKEPDVRLLFIGGRRGLEGKVVPEAGIPFHALPTSSLRDPDSRLALIGALVGIPLAFIDALVRIALFRPSAMVTSGGAIAIPVVLAA